MKYLFVLSLIPLFASISMTDVPTTTKAKLIYVGDPMCSWCYGFSPELTKALQSLEDQVDLELIMGGLRPYNTQTMKDLGDFLKEHWQEVSHRSGQPFQYEILKDHHFVYDTEPACRAVRVARALAPNKELAFFKAIQDAFYAQNQNTNQIDTYLAIAQKLDIDQEKFQKAFSSEEMKVAVRRDFERAAEMGIRGFPSMVLQKGEKLFLIANGYRTAEQIIEAVEQRLEK
ncbi:MAG: DsbA family protein [Bacteroidota bacterium]